MEMTCSSPGKRVTFKEVYGRAGRTYPQARADLAGFTKFLLHRFGRDKWPVNVAQGADGVLVYDADPAIAAAWNGARK